MSKPYEVMLSTKNFSTPELDAEMKGPRVQASKEYIQARSNLINKGKFESYDFKPFNVIYDFDNGTTSIMGIKLPTESALEKLAFIYDARQNGKTINEIKKELPKILK